MNLYAVDALLAAVLVTASIAVVNILDESPVRTAVSLASRAKHVREALKKAYLEGLVDRVAQRLAGRDYSGAERVFAGLAERLRAAGCAYVALRVADRVLSEYGDPEPGRGEWIEFRVRVYGDACIYCRVEGAGG